LVVRWQVRRLRRQQRLVVAADTPPHPSVLLRVLQGCGQHGRGSTLRRKSARHLQVVWGLSAAREARLEPGKHGFINNGHGSRLRSMIDMAFANHPSMEPTLDVALRERFKWAVIWLALREMACTQQSSTPSYGLATPSTLSPWHAHTEHASSEPACALNCASPYLA
jgi:hypothetical protein